MSASRVSTAGFTALLIAASGLAQSIDNKGDEFIMAFLPNNSAAAQVEVHLACDVATTVTVEWPMGAPIFSVPVAVVPGSVTIVALPVGPAPNWVPNAVLGNCVHAFAADEFICYMINREQFTSDAALGLPVDTMNTEFIVADYNPRFVGAEFVVYAAFDNTTVEITPTRPMVGRPAGVTFSVLLNRGQGYFGKTDTNPANTLTGTIISANRPVGLTNGDGCTQVPTGTTACDHIFEVGQPVQSWGMSIAVANLPNRPNGSIYRIIGSLDGTNVLLDGVPFGGVLNRGAFFETGIMSGNHIFEADQPFYVAQYMTGQDSPGATLGDPAMGNMIPTAQFLNAYTFSPVGGGQFAQNFLTIIAANIDVGVLTVDGIAVPAPLFSAIGTSGFSAAILPLTGGTHTTASPNGHGITVEGFNGYDSYIYPGGALFQFINPVGDENPPLCDVTYPGTQPPTATIVATDNRPSEDTNDNHVLDPGEDLNGNGTIDKDTGIFFVVIEAGSTNLQIAVDPFIPGDPSVNITASMIDTNVDATGSIRITDGAGNVCLAPVTLVSNRPPVVTCNDPITLWSPNHDLVDVQSVFSATDPDGDPLTLTIVMYSDESEVATPGSGCGRHAPDFKNELNTLNGRGLLVRSSRRGNGNGRWYVAVITADDGRGGQATDVCLVAVCPHAQSPASKALVIAEGEAGVVAIAAAVANATPLPIAGTFKHGVAAPEGPKQ